MRAHECIVVMTYLQHIARGARLGADAVLVTPAAGKARLVELALLHFGHACYASNVVLHQWREAGALHGSIDQSRKELIVQVDWVILLLDASREQPQQLTGCCEGCTSLADSDAIGGIPRELLQCADQALVRPLGAVSGERRLKITLVSLTSKVPKKKRQRNERLTR